MKILLQKYKKIKAFVFFWQILLKAKFREIFKKDFFYVIGDSHVQCFQHEFFKYFHLGPSTAYKLGFKKSTTKGREKALNTIKKIYKNKRINIIFVFGELDTRIHINKAICEKKISLEKAIIKTVNSYMKFLRYVKNKFPLINMHIFNVLPQGEEKNIYNFPYYADRKKRTHIAERLNAELKKQCLENNFKFIYIYDNLIDKAKNRKKEYIYDEVHFNRKIVPFVIKEIKKL